MKSSKHIKKSRELDWDELSYAIILLELLIPQLKNKKETRNYEEILDIYEIEKQNRLNKITKSWHIHNSYLDSILDEEGSSDIDY